MSFDEATGTSKIAFVEKLSQSIFYFQWLSFRIILFSPTKRIWNAAVAKV